MKTFSFLAALALAAFSCCKSQSGVNCKSEMTCLGAGEEVINGLPPELSTLDSLVVDLSTFLFAESRVLSSGSLSEVFVVRLGNFLLLLFNGSGGGYSSLALGSTPSSVSSFSRSLRGVLLLLSILLALLFSCKSAWAVTQ
jgi:hypothetical protein